MSSNVKWPTCHLNFTKQAAESIRKANLVLRIAPDAWIATGLYIVEIAGACWETDSEFEEYRKNITDYERDIIKDNNVLPMIFYTFISLIGLLSNAYLFCIFIHYKKMKTIPNAYIINLAIANIIVILIWFPVMIHKYTVGIIENTDLCIVLDIFHSVGVFIPIYITLAMTTDRYFAIKRALRFDMRDSRISKKALALIIILAIWIFCTTIIITIAFSSAAQSTLCSYIGGGLDCNSHRKERYFTNLTVGFTIPVLFSLLLFHLTFRELRMSTANLPEHMVVFTTQVKKRIKTVKLAMFLVIMLIVCVFPYHIGTIAIFYYTDHYLLNIDGIKVMYFVQTVIEGLHYTFYCFTPLLIYSMSEIYHEHMNINFRSSRRPLRQSTLSSEVHETRT